jgi:hypothetical protein
MAGTKTWADGDDVTAADLNGYVRDQWITICTAGTRPTTSQEGRTIFETDTDRYYRWDGAAWQLVKCLGAWDTWTSATVTQSNTPTADVDNHVMIKEGRHARATARWVFTSAGTASNRMTLTLPYTSATADGMILGSFYYFDAGANIYAGQILQVTSTTAQFFITGNGDLFGASPAVTIASTDQLIVDLNYRAAS